MKPTGILILMVMLTVQSLGLSFAAPVYPSSASNMMVEVQNMDTVMPCHSSDAGDNETDEITDCCAEQDCSCCWGCSGLLTSVFNLANSRFSAGPSMIESTRHALSGNLTSLYRPPIFA